MRSALALAAILAFAAPVSATVFGLEYSGTASFQPPRSGDTIRLDELGYGRFDVDTSLTSISLSSGLADFAFTTEMTETRTSFVRPPMTYAAGKVTYSLADLDSFEATLSNGQITSLSFFTKTKSVGYAGGNAVSFSNFRGTGFSSVFGGGQQPRPVGNVTTSVPEPASWALMLAGFGAIGAALRRRRTVGKPLPG